MLPTPPEPLRLAFRLRVGLRHRDGGGDHPKEERLDREATTEAFGEFLAGRILGKNQIHFINMVIGHLTRNGAMEVDRLYESPFTEIAPQGPDGLFPSDDIDRIVSILDSVRATATPVPEVA